MNFQESRLVRLLSGLLIAAMTFGLALGGIEMILAWFPQLLPHQLREVNNRMETAVRWDETVSGDPYLGFKLKPDIARTVSLDGAKAEMKTVRMIDPDVGFRDMGVPFQGPPADLAIGDSFTVCYGVQPADCWVRLVGSGAGRDIVDMGVSGYSALAASRMLDRYGAAFKPRLVLHGLFLNDFEENLDFASWEHSGKDNMRDWYHEQSLGEFGYQLYKRFRTYRLLHSMLRAERSSTFRLQDNGLNLYMSPSGWWVHATEHAAQPQYLDFMKQVLLDEDRRAHAMGAQLVILLFPFKEQVYWDRMLAHDPELRSVDVDQPFRLLTEFGREHGLQMIDLTPALRARAQAGEQVYFSMDAHWNPHGNAVVADTVLGELKERGLL